MKVTALKAQTRNTGRVAVYLDGRRALSLAGIVAARLRLGQEMDEARLEALRRQDEQEQAYERALRFLAVRPRSEAEVRRRLRGQRLAPDVVEAVLERLRGAGLVDDEAFAKYWAENRAAFRPRSQRALRSELRAKGVGAEALETALAGADDAAAAYQLASRRGARLQALPRDEFRRKLGEFLARRGFDYETAASVVERVWREQSSGPQAD